MDKFLPYLKTYAALIGAILTGVAGVVGGDTLAGQIITVVLAITTAIVTFQVPYLGSGGVSGNAGDDYQGQHEA